MAWMSVQMAQPLYALGEENSAFKKKQAYETSSSK